MILGIIPARGGSKGIPRKNIKMIAGKPLIAWTIEAAKESRLMDRFVVSTEDQEIAQVAKLWGAEVIDRPEELAGDSVATVPVLRHVLSQIEADVVVWLQCTSPVREKGLIDKCIQKFLDEKADSLATGYHHVFFEWGSYDRPRQELKPVFHDDGNVYVIKSDLVKSGKLWGEKMAKMEISRDQNFEIDDQFDFWLNEQVLKHKKS